MQTENNRTIAHRFIQAWNADEEGIVDTLASPDIIVFYSHFPQPIQGADEFKAILRQTHTSFPDLQISVQKTIGEGDQVVLFWSY
jgi:predicted ester cyclase